MTSHFVSNGYHVELDPWTHCEGPLCSTKVHLRHVLGPEVSFNSFPWFCCVATAQQTR